MATKEKLRRDIEALAEHLEDHPERWFDNPCGWLLKPNYKRAAQENSKTGKRRSWAELGKQMVGGSVYSKRWFVLDLRSGFLKYYADESMKEEKWVLNLAHVSSVKTSAVHDAPDYSLDLVTRDVLYTIAAENSDEMIRWAYALENAIRLHKEGKTPIQSPNRLKSQRSSMEMTKFNANGDVVLGDTEEVAASEEAEEGEEPLPDEERWLRYDFTFPKQGPLMMNVMGTVDHDENGEVISYWIIVTSFARDPDGTRGASELSGKINVKDYIVGVNGQDLTMLPFQQAMMTIREASWPKTLHFLRDNTATAGTIFLECWAYVFYPSLNRPRKRYIELRFDCINFRKPTPGGSALVRRDAFFTVEQISYLRPQTDLNLPADQQHCLRVVCNAQAVVHQVDWQDHSIGIHPVEVVELYFGDAQTMNDWCDHLAHPSNRQDDAICIGQDIPVSPIEIIEQRDPETGGAPNTLFGIKSSVTGQFTAREFVLEKGYLIWKRPKVPETTENFRKESVMSRGKKMFIANQKKCGLRAVRAISDNYADPKYRYQIVLQSPEERIVMGMPDETTLMQWLDALRELVEEAPVSTRQGLVIPDTAAEMGRALTTTANQSYTLGAGDDESPTSPVGDAELSLVDGCSDNALQGVLFYKHNVQMKFSWTKQYSQYWFILRGNMLHYYKTQYDVAFNSKSLGSIDLRNVLEVRESLDLAAPENSFELVTTNRVYTLTAEDEPEMIRWIDGLADCIEMRLTAVKKEVDKKDFDDAETVNSSNNGRQQESGTGTPVNKESWKNSENAEGDSVEAKRKQILREGYLNWKTVNKLTFLTTWKKRYFVLANGVFTYFGSPEEVFVKTKDQALEISLLAVVQIESSRDSKCSPDCGFDIHAHVRKGGDSDTGVKVFTFEAESAESCKEWMEKLCESSGKFCLKKNYMGYYSEIDETLEHRRDEQKFKAASKYVMSPAASEDAGDASVGGYSQFSSAAPSPTLSSGVASPAYLSDDSNSVAPRRKSGSLLESRPGFGSFHDVNAAARGGGGRGRGMGRGIAFANRNSASRPASSARVSLDGNNNSSNNLGIAGTERKKLNLPNRRHTTGEANYRHDEDGEVEVEIDIDETVRDYGTEGESGGRMNEEATTIRPRLDSSSSGVHSEIDESVDALNINVGEKNVAEELASNNSNSYSPPSSQSPSTNYDETTRRASHGGGGGSVLGAGRRGGRGGGRGRGPGL